MASLEAMLHLFVPNHRPHACHLIDHLFACILFLLSSSFSCLVVSSASVSVAFFPLFPSSRDSRKSSCPTMHRWDDQRHQPPHEGTRGDAVRDVRLTHRTAVGSGDTTTGRGTDSPNPTTAHTVRPLRQPQAGLTHCTARRLTDQCRHGERESDGGEQCRVLRKHS